MTNITSSILNNQYQQHNTANLNNIKLQITNILMSQARVKPDNSAWFEDANLKNLIVCQV